MKMVKKLGKWALYGFGGFVALIVIIAIVAGGDSGETKKEKKEETVAVSKEEAKSEKKSDELDKKEKDDKKKTKKANKESKKKVEEDAKDEEVSAEGQKVLEKLALSILEENMGEFADIEFKETEKMFVLTPTDPAFTVEMLQMMEGTKSHDDWIYMTDSFVTLTESIAGVLGNGYLLAVANPANPDNIIFSAMDGVALYDVFNE